jgi:acyl-homoserine-lactone acylase
MFAMRLLILLIIITGFSVCLKAQINPEKVTIVRDSFGVPHIFAATDPEVSYGLAWAHAEDDFRSLQEVIWPIKGLTGKALGKAGAAVDYAYRLFRCREVTEERWHLLSPAFVKLIEGYIQGINDYAKANPGEVLVKGTFPISAKEYVSASVLALTVFNGADRVLAQIFNNTIPNADFSATEKGSNAFSIHGNKTTTGEAMLVVNAHQPNTGSQAFYEAHVHSDEGWNALGGLLAGGPCILHGVNEHLGWAHTVNWVDRLDVYQLKMHPHKKNWYAYDGEWKKLETTKVKLKIKGIPVKIGRKAYWSEYGATMRNKTGVYSIRLGANMRIGALEQWYYMNKARNFTEFYNVLKRQELSMFNIMYADKYDTIFYINYGLIPERKNIAGVNWKSTVPGNTESTRWTTFRPIEALVHYINPSGGFLFNVNHSPFLAAHPADNKKVSNYPLTDGWETWHNNRSKRVYELMPLDKQISYEQLKAIKFDKQYPSSFAFPENIDSLWLLNPADHPELSDIISTLQQWDKRAVPESKGAAIFHLLLRHLQNQPFEVLTRAKAVESLEAVKAYQLKYFSCTGITLGELQQLVRGNIKAPMYGMPDLLSAEWAVQQPDGTLKITGGDGYIMFARFAKGELPKLETLNMYGASAKPGSAHFADQVPLYLQQQTKTMWLDKKTVFEKAKSIYSPGKNADLIKK